MGTTPSQTSELYISCEYSLLREFTVTSTHFVLAFLMSWRLSEKKKMVPKKLHHGARTTQVCLLWAIFFAMFPV